jgi:hypothetical protein
MAETGEIGQIRASVQGAVDNAERFQEGVQAVEERRTQRAGMLGAFVTALEELEGHLGGIEKFDDDTLTTFDNASQHVRWTEENLDKVEDSQSELVGGMRTGTEHLQDATMEYRTSLTNMLKYGSLHNLFGRLRHEAEALRDQQTDPTRLLNTAETIKENGSTYIGKL